MRRFAGLLAAALAAAAGPSAAGPAEAPPDDFAGETYVDSAGCAFRRAELGGRTVWAEWLDPAGAPRCGLQPSLPPPGLSDLLPAIPPNRAGRAPDFPRPGAYVQVGAFGQPDNADRVAQQLRLAGLPALRQDFRRSRGTLRVLYAGPFAGSEATRAALEAVRALGFADAFVWEQRP